MSQTAQTIKINTLNIALAIFGNPEATPILALHGWQDNAASFFPLGGELTKYNYQLICPDIVGHGLSDHLPPGSHYTLLDYLFFVVDLLNTLPYTKIAIIGHSFGSFMALLAASLLPEKITSIITLDALGPITSPGNKTYERMQQHLQNYGHMPVSHFKTKAEAVAARAVKENISEMAATLLVERDLKQVGDQFTWRHDPRLKTQIPLRLTQEQADDFLTRIKAPIGFIRANSGYMQDDGYLQKNLAALKNLTTHWIVGHHHAHMDNPAGVAKLIHEFIHTHSN